MDEKFLTIDPQIIEKLIQHIEGQSSLFEATIPVAIGAVIAVVAVLAGNWSKDYFTRKRRYRVLCREKLEGAIQALFSLRRWARTAAHNLTTMIKEGRDTGTKPPMEDLKKVAKHFDIEGDLGYEEVLFHLIYSDIKDPGKELAPKLLEFRKALLKWKDAGSTAGTPDGKEWDTVLGEFETACNNLIQKAKNEILKNYKP